LPATAPQPRRPTQILEAIDGGLPDDFQGRKYFASKREVKMTEHKDEYINDEKEPANG
jgi:hypothetical protein